MAEKMKKVGLFVIFLGFSICFVRASSVKKDLSLSLQNKKIQDLTSSGLILVFNLNVSNSSSSLYYLSRYDYRLVVQGTEYLNLQNSLDEPIKINPRVETLISLPLKISYSLLFQAVKGIEAEDKLNCYLTGNIIFRDEKKKEGKIPIAFSGEFPIFKDPEIEFHSLEVKDLTIGGADLSLELSFKNKNGFELLVERISYSLELGGKLTGNGEIRGDKNIESRAEKTFSLPFLLDFFEIGKEIYDYLQQPSLPCRFTGELEAETVWGKLKVPFDKSEKVRVSKSS